METKSNKIVGYVLLALGLVIIFYGIYSSYGIFMAKKDAPKVFSYDSSGIVDLEINKDRPDSLEIDQSRLNDPSYLKSLSNQKQSLTDSVIQEQISNQMKEIIPTEFILKLLNLSSWFLFVFILIFSGSKISSLGIKLLKE